VTGGRRRRDRTAALFWLSVLSMPFASVVVITVLAHALPEGDLASVSLVFSLSLVGTVVPMGVQARVAADTAVHGTSGPIAVVPAVLGTLLLVAVSVPAALVLDVGIPAVVLPSMSLGPAMVVAAIRGDLVGRSAFGAASRNYLVEGSIRLLAGVGLGIAFGADGVGASLLLCTLGALLAAPRRYPSGDRIRLPATLIATAALIVAVNWDMIVAPRLLGDSASTFVAAALPAKGVYMALSAAAWLAVPSVRNHHSFRSVVRPVWLQVLAGVGLSLLLVPAAPIIGQALGRPAPQRGLLLVLGLGMALGAGSWMLLQLRLVRGDSAPWVPPTVGLVAIAGLSIAFRTSDGLAIAMLVGGGVGLVVGLGMLMVEVGRRPLVTAATEVAVLPVAEPSVLVPPAPPDEEPLAPINAPPPSAPGPFAHPHPAPVAEPVVEPPPSAPGPYPIPPPQSPPPWSLPSPVLAHPLDSHRRPRPCGSGTG
jgi:hypothetical protein